MKKNSKCNEKKQTPRVEKKASGKKGKARSKSVVRLADLGAVIVSASGKDGAPALTVGIDLGDRTSHYCVLSGNGDLVREGKVATTGEGLKALLEGSERMRVAIEVGQHSRWVSRVVKELGHEVITASTRQVQLIYKGEAKSDKKDAEALARLARLDPKLLHGIEHRGEAAQLDLMIVKMRAALVGMRTDLINMLRGTVKSEGVRLAACSTDSFGTAALEGLGKGLEELLRPVAELVERVTETIQAYEQKIEEVGKKYTEVKQLQQVVGVGPLISTAFVLTIENPWRFEPSRKVGKYLGMTPGQYESGGMSQEKGITKAGDGYLRGLLVQGAHYILGPLGPDTDLQRWGRGIAKGGGKRGKKRAVVAVARKLAILLLALWKSGAKYEPLKNSKANGEEQNKFRVKSQAAA